jgi:thioredoxin 1
MSRRHSYQHRFFSRIKPLRVLSEDPEIAKIMQKKMEEMLKPKPEPEIEPGIIDLNDSNFDQIISAENPTLVDFWAEWCGPCKSMHPIFESLSKTYPNVKFARVNVDNNQNISMKFAVQSIPTFIMFKSGQIVDKMMGAVGAPGIHMICKKHSK